jgi:Pyridoxamine 5'-phosphate oxidase
LPNKRSTSKISPRAGRPHAPGYGLPKGNKGLLPWRWAEQRLKKSHNYWITTVKPADSAAEPANNSPANASTSNAAPHTMVVWGLWQDGQFFFSTGSKSRKARNLAQNPNCILCTEKANEAVIVEGTAEIADVAARRKFFPAYERKYKRRHSRDERTGLCPATAHRLRPVGEIFGTG